MKKLRLRCKSKSFGWLAYGIICIFLAGAVWVPVRAEFLQSAAAEDRPSANGFLYAIQKAGKKSYLLGTIHSGFSEKQKLGRNIVEILAGVDDIYLEANIADRKRSGNLIDTAGFDPAGPGVRSLIGDTYFNFFKNYTVGRLHLFDQSRFENIRPWLLAMLVPTADPKVDQIATLKWGTETQINEYAATHHIPVMELEGLALQVRLYNSMDYQQQSNYFLSYVDNVQSHYVHRVQVRDTDAWTRSSLADLENTWQERKARPDFYSKFHTSTIVEGRNPGLVEKIVDVIRAGKVHLFAVGEQHLVGENGLLKQLRDKGFKVEPCCAGH